MTSFKIIAVSVACVLVAFAAFFTTLFYGLVVTARGVGTLALVASVVWAFSKARQAEDVAADEEARRNDEELRKRIVNARETARRHQQEYGRFPRDAA